MSFERNDSRGPADLRPVRITTDFMTHAEGSALIEMGNTRVICTASVEDRVPPFLRNKGQGWITAEYSMLPRATTQRTSREIGRGGPSGRTHEIQRLIGRSIRAIADMTALGERTITIDCDVIQADGGTRTASITGGYIAFELACRRAMSAGLIRRNPVKNQVAAVSVGIVGETPLLDLKYDEDSRAEVDMNIVCTSDGRFIEVQGTAEGAPFSKAEMDQLLKLGEHGIQQLLAMQRDAIASALR